MAETTIETPPYANIEQKLIIGQQAAIRRIDTANPEDLARLIEIESDRERIRWFISRPESYQPKTEKQLKEIVDNPEGNDVIYAVSGALDREDIIQKKEEGRLQGIININSDDPERIKQIKEQGLNPPINDDIPVSSIIEISFAKLKTAPSGQIASALRQVCVEYDSQTNKNNPNSESNTIINAYVMSDGRGTNEPSIRVLEAAGFERKGRIQYDEDARDKDILFTLNWQKLDQILKESAKKQI